MKKEEITISKSDAIQLIDVLEFYISLDKEKLSFLKLAKKLQQKLITKVKGIKN